MLLSRRNQMLLEFSFWNEPQPRAGPNIYELRTYKLKVPPSHQIPACLPPSLPQCCFTGTLRWVGPVPNTWTEASGLSSPPGSEQRSVRTYAHLCTLRCKSVAPGAGET